MVSTAGCPQGEFGHSPVALLHHFLPALDNGSKTGGPPVPGWHQL